MRSSDRARSLKLLSLAYSSDTRLDVVVKEYNRLKDDGRDEDEILKTLESQFNPTQEFQLGI